LSCRSGNVFSGTSKNFIFQNFSYPVKKPLVVNCLHYITGSGKMEAAFIRSQGIGVYFDIKGK
jgi:hypothetical protein